MYEVVLAKVFLSSMGPTSGPDIEIFKIFQKQWHLIDRSRVTIAIDPDGTSFSGSLQILKTPNCSCRERISGFWSAAG